MADVDDFVDDLAGDRGKAKRVVSIAVNAFLMRDLQEPLMRFAETRPLVDLRTDLGQYSLEDLRERVERRSLDLACFLALDNDDVPGSEFIREEPLAIFVGQNHPLGSGIDVAVEDLRNVPAIHLTPRVPMRRLIDRVLARVGAAGGRVGLETDEFGLILSSLHRNHGFACMPKAMNAEVGQTHGLVEVSLRTALPSLQVRIIARRAARHDPVLQDLRSTITAVL